MAQTIKGLCRANLSLLNNLFFKNNSFNAGVRFLYTEKSLGILAYENSRKTYHNQFATVSETFRSKMQELCNSPDATIFTEDMKAMVHLINNNEEDLHLVETMIEKYIETNKEFHFGTYLFGPVVMRMYSYLKEPVKAYQSFNNFFETSFYQQLTSVQILFNLLYLHQMYPEMRELYDKILSVDKWKGMANRCAFVMTAGCYKENTMESLEYATSKWKSLLTQTIKPNGRSTILLAYLAIKQNSPDLALELACVLNNQRLVPVRNIKCLACTHLKKYVNLIPQMKSLLAIDDTTTRIGYYADVIKEVEEFITSNPGEGSTDVLSLINALRAERRIMETQTLEEVLLRPYDSLARIDKYRNTLNSKNYLGKLNESRNERKQYLERKAL